MGSKHFSFQQLQEMEQRTRAQFINSLGGFKSVVLVGTINAQQQTNLAVFNSLFHIGAQPPLCGLIFRPDTVARHTLENILATGMYTINHLNSHMYQQAHQSSARYGANVSEFDATGLTPEYGTLLVAPYVKESRVRLGMELAEKIDLSINGTILVIGKIVEVFIPEDCLRPDGFVDIEQAGTLTVSGLDSYHTTQRLARLSYAKPGSFPTVIDEARS